MFSAQARYSGAQFDDDLNQLKLERYFVLDLYAERALTKKIEGFVAIENALNQRYDVSLTPSTIPGSSPIRTLGPPFLARIGMRLKLGAL
jgi:outer membrane receptor protein involved in Fe transport